MKVALDFRVMQVGHQLRGIGEVFRNAVVELDRRLPVDDRILVVFDPAGPPLGELVGRLIGSDRIAETIELPAPAGRVGRLGRLLDSLSPEHQARLAAADVFVQLDFGLGVPATVPSVVVVHDLIPLELGDRYPDRYWPRYGTARQVGLPRRVAATKAVRRELYVRNLTRALTRAATVLADSAYTAGAVEAFAVDHRVAGISERLTVARLGHRPATGPAQRLNVLEQAQVDALGLGDVPYLLFLGGVDERRRIDLLVDAFNQLRAQGRPLKLVLAGDTLASVDTVGSEPARRALRASSYAEDIHLLGYVSEAERRWLYGHAAAFVFPSEHEGFGLPVIEALGAGCPVVAFENTSIPEVAGPGCHLVGEGWRDLLAGVAHVLDLDPAQIEADIEAGRTWSSQFTWEEFGSKLTAAVERLRPAQGPPVDSPPIEESWSEH